MTSTKASLLALAATVLAGSVWASEPTPGGAPDEERFEFASEAIERLSEADLKDFYLRCAREAVRGRLGHGEIALCSMGYERLLKVTFGGDFRALLEWRRGLGRPAQPLPSPF